MSEWFYHDPDYRLEHRRTARLMAEQHVSKPSEIIDNTPYCETCFRTVDPSKAIRIDTNWDYETGERILDAPEMSARLNPNGKRFIGRDCYRKLQKAGYINP